MVPLEDIIKFLTNNLNDLVGIYLFGSHADASATETSDVDLAILCKYPKSPTPIELYKLKLDLGHLINKDVDLIDLQKANTDFRFQIITTSKRIYCSNIYDCDFFEMISISMYQKLELERAEIIQQFKETGKIYG